LPTDALVLKDAEADACGTAQTQALVLVELGLQILGAVHAGSQAPTAEQSGGSGKHSQCAGTKGSLKGLVVTAGTKVQS
jgi:hypothetical protein